MKLPILLAVITVFILCMSCSREEEITEAAGKSEEMLVAPALEDLDRGNAQSALDKAQVILRKDPENLYALQVKSMALASLGRSRDAAKVLEDIVLREPGNLDVHHILGTVLFSEGLWEKAAEHLEKSLAAPNRKEKARELLVTCYEKLNRPDRAIAMLEAMLSEHPENTVLLTHMGNLLASTGEYKHAVDKFHQALTGTPKLPATYHGLAVCQAALEKYENAIETLNKAINRFPEEIGFRHTLAQAYLQLGRALDALTVISQIEEIAGKSKDLDFLRNTAIQMLKEQGKPVPPK
jgi:Tfp pilus assembly protein PilF